MKPGGNSRQGDPEASESVSAERRQLLTWLWRLPVLATLAGLGYALFEGSNVLFRKQRPADEPRFEAVEPLRVASLTSFSKPWEAVPFDLQGVPALALRLPEPIAGGVSQGEAHLAAFSRICTHQACIVSLNRDLEAIAFGFNYRTDKPELVCPCHLSVFSPSQAGRAVSGPAVEPLPRVRLALDDGQVLAVGIEKSR